MIMNSKSGIYDLLMEGYYDNYFGRKINTELFRKLKAFNPSYDKENYKKMLEEHESFCNEVSLRYFGELLERYNERDFIKNTQDLRTLIYFAVLSLSGNYYLDYNTDQISSFFNKATNSLIEEFDFFSAAILIQTQRSIYEVENIVKLSEMVVDYIIKNDLSFYDIIYGIYSCIKFSRITNLNDDFKDKIHLLYKKLDSIKIVPFENLDNAHIYLMLAYIVNYNKYFNSSRNFKNKQNYKTFRLYHKICSREIKEITANDVFNSMINPEKIPGLYYLNFLAEQNLNLITNEIRAGRVPYVARERIENNLIKLYGLEEEVKDFALKVFNKKLFKLRLPQNDIIDFYVSKGNFKNLLDNFSRVKSFYFNYPKFSYLLEEKNEDLFDMLSNLSKVDLVSKRIEELREEEKLKNKDNYEKIQSLLIKYQKCFFDRPGHLVNISDYILKNNIYSYKSLLGLSKRLTEKIFEYYEPYSIESSEQYMKFAIDVYNLQSDYEYLLNASDNFIQITEQEIIKMHKSNSIDFIYYSKNKELVKEYLVIVDKIMIKMLHKEDQDNVIYNYLNYVCSNIQNEKYISSFDITEEGKDEVLNYIFQEMLQEYSKEKLSSTQIEARNRNFLTTIATLIINKDKYKENFSILDSLKSEYMAEKIIDLSNRLNKSSYKDNEYYIKKDMLEALNSFKSNNIPTNIAKLLKELFINDFLPTLSKSYPDHKGYKDRQIIELIKPFYLKGVLSKDEVNDVFISNILEIKNEL